MPTNRPRSPLSDQLDREWRRLTRRRHPSIATWRSGDPDLDRRVRRDIAGVDSLDDLLDLCHRRRAADADALLHWLLDVGRSQPLAHRVVVQRTIPLVVAGARRQRGSHAVVNPIDEAITSLTMAVASADLPPGVGHVAPRLASRAFHDAFRKTLRRRHHTAEVPSSSSTLDECVAPLHEVDPLVVAARLLDIARGAGLHPDAVDLARRLARGDSTVEIAAEAGCTDRTIRYRRARVVDELRAVAERHHIDRHDHDSLVALEPRCTTPARAA